MRLRESRADRSKRTAVPDLGGSAAYDPTADDVDARDVGHALERQRAQRLQPGTTRGCAAADTPVAPKTDGT